MPNKFRSLSIQLIIEHIFLAFNSLFFLPCNKQQTGWSAVVRNTFFSSTSFFIIIGLRCSLAFFGGCISVVCSMFFALCVHCLQKCLVVHKYCISLADVRSLLCQQIGWLYLEVEIEYYGIGSMPVKHDHAQWQRNENAHTMKKKITSNNNNARAYKPQLVFRSDFASHSLSLSCFVCMFQFAKRLRIFIEPIECVRYHWLFRIFVLISIKLIVVRFVSKICNIWLHFGDICFYCALGYEKPCERSNQATKSATVMNCIGCCGGVACSWSCANLLVPLMIISSTFQ